MADNPQDNSVDYDPNGPGQSFAKQMFNVDDPSQILTFDGPSKTDPTKVRYRFAGDGQIYTASKDKPMDAVLKSIWDQKSPGLLSSLGGAAMYGLPADASSALAYALNAGGFDQSSQEWRDYSNKLHTDFNQKYGQYMVPGAQSAWDQGELTNYAMQTIGSGLPYVGLALAGGLAGGPLGEAALGAGATEAGAVAGAGPSLASMSGAFLGSTAITSPITVAQFADRQVKEMKAQGVENPEQNIDWVSALGSGIAASGMQSLPMESILYGGPILGALKGMGVELGSKASTNILAHVADVAGTNALVGLGTDALSRAQADMPLLDDQAQQEYFDAMVGGALVGLPFGLGKGLYENRGGLDLGRKQRSLDETIAANTASNVPPPAAAAPSEGGPSKYDYVFYNHNMDYGIKDVYQAQEYMQNVKYRKNGVDHNAFDDFRSSEQFGPNFTDDDLVAAARRVSYIKGRNDLVGGEKQGILIQNASDIPQKHSNDPQVLTRAAFLTDKAGYKDTQVRLLSDDVINKLYEAKIKNFANGNPQADAILKTAMDHVDPQVVEDVKNYGSLADRPQAKERIDNNAASNTKILTNNARQALAKELMDKQARMNPQNPRVGFTRAPGGRFRKPGPPIVDPSVDPARIAEAERQQAEGGPSQPTTETNNDRLSAFQGDKNPNAFFKPNAMNKATAEAVTKPQPNIKPKDLVNFLAQHPVFQKLAQTDNVAKELMSKVRRMNQPVRPRERKVQAEKPTGANFSGEERNYGHKQENVYPDNVDPRDVLGEQRQYLRSLAERDMDKIHPDLAKGLNDLSKALSETMPKSNLLNDGKKPIETTTTKAIKTGPMMDVLTKRAQVSNTLKNAFRTISDNNSKYFGDMFDKLANSGELTVKDVDNLTTMFNTAFSVRNRARDVEPLLLQDLYKQIRSKLPLKQQKSLDDKVDTLNRWFKNSHDVNEKDMGKFKPEDVEAAAFNGYMRGEFGPNLKDFRNSTHDKLFRGLDTTFKRIQKELADQDVRNINDVFASNLSANENIPPGAKGEPTRAIQNEIVEGPMTKDAATQLGDIAGKNHEQIANEPTPAWEGNDLGGAANNIGSIALGFSKYLSTVAQGRMLPAMSKLFNSRYFEEEAAGKYQVQIGRKIGDAQKKYGRVSHNETMDLISHLRKTDQSIKTNDQGQMEITKPDGSKVTLSREYSNQVREVNDVYKEVPRLWQGITKKGLNYFDQEGLNENTSIEGVERGINKLNDAITGNPIDEQRSRLVHRRELLTNIRDRLKEFNNILDPDKPYVPFMRFGDYMVQVVDKSQKDEDGKPKTVHFESLNDANLFGLKTKLPIKQAEQLIQQKGLYNKFSDPKYEIRHFQMTYNNVNKYINRNMVSHELVQGLIANGLNHNIDLADMISQHSVGIEPDEAKSIQGNIANLVKQDENRVMRLINARGMGRFGVESRNIDGHSTDWGRVSEAYTNISSKSLARLENGREWSKLLSNIELEGDIPDPVKQQLRNFTDYVTSTNKDWGGLRAFNYVMAMGFRPMSAVLQLFQLPQQISGQMLAHSPNPIGNLLSLSRETAKSVRSNITGKTDMYSPEVKDLIAKHEVSLKGTVKQDTLVDYGFSQRPLEKGFSNFMDASGIMLTNAEAITRRAAFTSFYGQLQNKTVLDRALRQRATDNLWQGFWQKGNEKGWSLPESLALYNMLETHGYFGKLGRGIAQKGALGSVFFPFTTYSQQMLETLGAQLSGKRGLPGALGGLWTAGSYLALAGIAGIPAWDMWKSLIETWNKKVNNVDMDTEMWLKESGVPLWARKGLLSQATGMDLSARLSQNVVASNLVAGLFKGDVKFTDLFGVPGTAASGALSGLEELFNPMGTMDSTVKAVMPALPASVQDMIKAEQMAFNPSSKILETGTGKATAAPSTSDVLTQAAGATPLDRSLQREKIYWTQKVNSEFNQFKSRLSENLAQATFMEMNGKPEEGKALKDQMRKELLNYARTNNMIITPEFWSGLNKSYEQRLMQKINPGGINSKPTTAQIQHARALFGSDQ